MRTLRTWIAASLLLFAVGALQAEQLTVDFVDGQLTLRSNAGWTQLDAGTRIPSTSIVRLGEFSVAQLSGTDTTILLSQNGPVDLATVLLLARKNPARNVFSKMASAIDGILLSSDNNGSTSGSVSAPSHSSGSGSVLSARSADKSLAFDDSPPFVDPSAQEEQRASEKGYSLLRDKRFKEAADAYLAAASDAVGNEQSRLTFLAAFATAASGNEPAALGLLLRIRNDEALVADPSYVLLRGSLLMESLRFLDALQLFARYDRTLSGAEPSPEVQKLDALCRKAIGQ
jgi:hypothetical protein